MRQRYFKILSNVSDYMDLYKIYMTLRLIPFHRNKIPIFSNLIINHYTDDNWWIRVNILGHEYICDAGNCEYPHSISEFSQLPHNLQLIYMIEKINVSEELQWDITSRTYNYLYRENIDNFQTKTSGKQEIYAQPIYDDIKQLHTLIVRELVRYYNVVINDLNSYSDEDIRQYFTDLQNKKPDVDRF